MENLKRIIPRGFEEALLRAVEVPTVNKIPIIVPLPALQVPSITAETNDDSLIYFILTALTITVGVIVYYEYTSIRKKQKAE